MDCHANEKMPDILNGRSLYAKVIPTVCNLKNMLCSLKKLSGNIEELKSWEKCCYRAYCMDGIKKSILEEDEVDWCQTMRNYIHTKHIMELGANVVDIYLVAFVAENYGVGKERFFQFVLEKGISKKVNSAQAIWQVGKGDGVYLGILNEDGSVKNWGFINKWLQGVQAKKESIQISLSEKLLEVSKWCEEYDYRKYPKTIYEELIVEGTLQANSMLVMGAWKTGSIIPKVGGTDYRDKDGNTYSFQIGWEQKESAHYIGWKYMMEHFEELKEKVPEIFPDNEPFVMRKLMSQQGIGFVYASFFLHCCYPEVYPLYDQHIYRAYKYEVTKGKQLPESASATWIEYKGYEAYFKTVCTKHGVQYQIMDRALWSYGKWLKRKGGSH